MMKQRITACFERRGPSLPGKPTLFGLIGLLLLLASPAGCGDGDGTTLGSTEPKIAFVVTRCTDTPQGYSATQELRIQQGDGNEITVAEFATSAPVPDQDALCEDWGFTGWGLRSVRAGAFQRLGMTRDGSLLVFEVTDDFSIVAQDQMVPPDEEGIFVIRTDGTGLRRLGDASRDPCFRYDRVSRREAVWDAFKLSPDGSTVTFTDIGPGPDGDTVQVVTMDLATGARRPVTRLPLTSVEPPPARRPTGLPSFLDADTISFVSYTNPVIGGEESNPDGVRRVFSVKTGDAETLRVVPFFAEPGGSLVEEFQITGAEPVALTLPVPGEPKNGCGWWGCVVFEVFVLDSESVLQLTTFERSDTLIARVSGDRQRIFFFSAGDPFGANPGNTRQIFSIDRVGSDLRQLTNFANSTQCWIYLLAGQDPATGWVVFSARSRRCAGPDAPDEGVQVFAIRPDGTGLHQLTHSREKVVELDGTVTRELVGPWISPRIGS